METLPIKIYNTLASLFRCELDVENNILFITIPKDLKISLLNSLDLSVGGEFNIDTLNGINIVSREHDINIDSFHANIFLNSLLSKQISEMRECIDIRNERTADIEKRKKIINRYNPKDDENYLELYTSLKLKCQELEKRIQELESNNKKLYDV